MSKRSQVTYPDGKVTALANLGWLYRRTRRAGGLSVQRMDATALGDEGMLEVHFHGGAVYECKFCDRNVLCEFLRLPRWRRYPQTFFGMTSDGILVPAPEPVVS